MRLSFDHLLTLFIKHDIYPEAFPGTEGSLIDDRTSGLLELVPEEKTEQLLIQNGLLLKKFKNSFQLFYQTEGPRKSDLKNLENTELYFKMHIKDMGFFSYTDASYLSPSLDKIVFFGPLADETVTPKVRTKLGLSFNYPLTNEMRPVQITVNSLGGENIVDKTITKAKIKFLQIDLAKAGTGAYSITEDTKQNDGIFISDIYCSLQNDTTGLYGIACFRFKKITVPYVQQKIIIQFKKQTET